MKSREFVDLRKDASYDYLEADLVELVGLEPTTSSLRTTRSPS